MEFIYAGIDGTGVGDNEEYRKTFADSFVNRLSRRWKPHYSFYRRGPTNMGTETQNLAVEACNHVKGMYNHERGVILAGYSRGAAAVIETAWWLRRDNIPFTA